MGCINRVGTEAPWNIGKFYGSSYFVDPRGNFLAQGGEDKDELVVAEMDLDMIEEVRRVWQFYATGGPRPTTSWSIWRREVPIARTASRRGRRPGGALRHLPRGRGVRRRALAHRDHR